MDKINREDAGWLVALAWLSGKRILTFSNTRRNDMKDEILKNKIVGGDEKNFQASYLNIQASAEVFTDIKTKKSYWNDMLKAWYSGPEDPNLAIIIISPRVIEYMGGDSMTPEVYIVE